MIEIIPAILPTSFKDLTSHLEKVRGLTRMVQIDICDGYFVPAKTFPYVDRDQFDVILREDAGLPQWEDFDFELDLMVKDSKVASEEWVRAGASRIIVHVESPDDRASLEALQPLRDTYGVGIEVALAINLDTPIEKLESLASLCSAIQCMGIASIGAQGYPLDERIFDRIQEVRRRYPEHTVSVDGGVKLSNAKALKEAGASRLVVGSALFDGDVEKNIEDFRAEVI